MITSNPRAVVNKSDGQSQRVAQFLTHSRCRVNGASLSSLVDRGVRGGAWEVLSERGLEDRHSYTRLKSPVREALGSPFYN